MNKSLRNKFIVLAVLVVVILVLDLVTKYVIDGMFDEGTGVSAIPNLFNIIVVHNYGAAWGIFEGSQIMLIILTFVFLGVFVWYFVVEKKKSWLLIITFSFLFAGCLGNLYDRIVFGYVRDFIQFAFWQTFPIFNFADVFLTFGVVMFVIYLLIPLFKKDKKEKSLETEAGTIKIEEVEKNGAEVEKENKKQVDEEKLIDESCKDENDVDENLLETKNAKKSLQNDEKTKKKVKKDENLNKNKTKNQKKKK